MNDSLKVSENIIRISYTNKPSLEIEWNWFFLIIIIVIMVLLISIPRIFKSKLSSKLFVGKVKIKVKTGLIDFEEEINRSFENIKIANRIHIELSTRKATIPVDKENDVINEIYNSWYELFKTVRSEIKSLPGEFLKNDKSSEKLIQLSTDVLNKGLRPHLTSYQAKFRKWYSEQLELKENLGKSPQEIQSNYTEFEEIIDDIKIVNGVLKKYQTELNKIIKG